MCAVKTTKGPYMDYYDYQPGLWRPVLIRDVDVPFDNEYRTDRDANGNVASYKVGYTHWPPDIKMKEYVYYALPEPYEQWVEDARFTIEPHAIDVINHLLDEGVSWWDKRFLRRFDTSVREGLLEPAESMIYRAFWLINDYLYDAESKGKDSSEKRSVLAHALCYKFWSGQVGRGCYKGHARIDSNDYKFTAEFVARHNDDSCVKFLEAIEQSEKAQEKALQDVGFLSVSDRHGRLIKTKPEHAIGTHLT